MSDAIELCELNTSLIHHFSMENNLNGLREIVSQHSEDIDKRNEANQTALHLACEVGNVEIAQFLISEGASCSIKDHNDFTPFLMACYNGNLECAKLFDISLCVPDPVDKNGWTALMWSVYKGHTEIVRLLLEQGANLHCTVSFNVTCLLWAAGRGFHEIVQMLCERGAKINHVDKYGNTAMIWAARRGASDIVQCLMDNNADPNIVGANGSSSLINAVKNGHAECARVLLSNPKVNVNQTDRDGRTALNFAAKRGSLEMTTMLLERGAYLNLADQNGDTPLMKAVKHGSLETVKALLASFADVDAKGKDRKTALHHACENGNVHIIRELLKCGCKIECTNANGETPLLRAVKSGNVLVTKVLISHDADVSAKDQDNDTCVHIAMRAQNIHLVELILQNPKHGRFLYQENKLGETAYDIDLRNNRKILSQLFGSKGFSTASMSSDSTLDVSSCSLAEMLSEPMLESPLCVGLYGKWGNNVLFMLKKIKDQIKLFTCPLTATNKNMFWLTLTLILYVAIVLSVNLALAFQERILAGLLTFVIIMIPSLFALLLIHIGNRLKKWFWARSASNYLHRVEDYLKLLLQICFLHQTSPSSAGKVRYVFVECKNITSFKEKDIMSGITSKLLKRTEKKIGKIAFRVARALPFTNVPRDEVKRTFRKICCFPSFFVLIFWVVGFSTLIMMLTAIYGSSPVLQTDQQKTDGLIAIVVISILLGCVLLLSAPILWNVFSSLLFSTNKISRNLGNEVHRNRSEINRLSRALSIIDSIKKTKTRICILINALEINDQCQLEQLIHAVHNVYSIQPIITVMCIDYHLLSSILRQSSVSFLDGGDLKGINFIHHVVQLPLFLPDKKRKKKYFTANDPGNSDTDETEGRDAIKRKKYPKHFDVTKWLVSHDCFHPANPLLIKRVASIISFTARLLRSVGKDFSWGALSSWIVLTELWAYSTTCMIVFISKRNMAHTKLLKSLFFDAYFSQVSQQFNKEKHWSKEIETCLKKLMNAMWLVVEEKKHKLEDEDSTSEWYTEVAVTSKTERSLPVYWPRMRHLISSNHSMDIHDSYWLHHFISSKCYALTVGDVVNFHQFTVNLDPALEELVPAFSDSWPAHTSSMHDSAVLSQASESSFDELPLSDWTVEDVCRRFKSIQGLDTSNFQHYQTFVHKNNFHGLALSLCDVDELKKELKTSFGDWCLIKKFIIETKRNATKTKRLSFNSLASTEKKGSDITGTRQENSHSEVETESSSTMRDNGKVSFDESYKNYLKLQHQTNSNHEMFTQQQNDNYPLLHSVDVNAN